jgi:hypothetical protein
MSFVDHTMLIHEKNCSLVDVSDQKPIWQGEEKHLPSADCGKILPLHEPPLS